MKKLVTLALAAGALGFPGIASAQDNILAEKPIYTLGDAKTWTAGEESYTFITADLAKLVAVPTNTANVYLYPENGTLNTPENQALGIQGFYIDMEKSTGVKTVTTTWEGAAADAYDIYLTDEVPTLDILSTTPTYSASGLGQYATNVANMPEGAQGRYLVFQPTKATNYGWGVKIRSISATAPAEPVLSAFTAQPLVVLAGASANMTLSAKDQFGIDMAGVQYSVTGGTLENGVLTVSGASAVISAKAGDVTLTQTVYAVSAPEAPLASNIALPIYTNTVKQDNSDAVFENAYNGGAAKLGRLTFANGDVAEVFGSARCIFFGNSNPATLNGWDKDINPSELGLGALHIDIFGSKDVNGNVVFERVTTIPERTPITLKAGEWNHIEVPVADETIIHTLSVRFDEANASDIVIANVYFSPVVDESDVTVPVLGDVKVVETGFNFAKLSMTATDDSKRLTYSLNVSGRAYGVIGQSGETVNLTVDGLATGTEYEAQLVVSDGKNESDVKTVKFTTKTFPTLPVPTQPAENVVSIFSSADTYAPATTFWLGTWGQSTKASLVTIDNNNYYEFTDFNYLGWEFAQHIDVSGCTHVHVDFYTENPTTFGFTPISPGPKEKGWIASDVKVGEWNSYDVKLSYFDIVDFTDLFQFKFDQGKNVECYIGNVYFWKDTSVTPDPEEPEEGNGKTYYGRVTDTFIHDSDNSKEYPYTLDYEVTHNIDKTLTIKATYNWTNGEPAGLVAGDVFVNNQVHAFSLAQGVRTATTSATFNSGDIVPINFYLPAAGGGVVQKEVQYEVGSASEKPSGILEVVRAAQADGAIYDLQGRKVAKAGRGFYIVNGKKVFVK